MNAIFISVASLIFFTSIRLNIISSIIISAFIGGTVAGLSIQTIWDTFLEGLGNSSYLALSYAIVGGFAHVISSSGITHVAFEKMIKTIKRNKLFQTKFSLMLLLGIVAIFSQSIIPIHVAFIPLVIPSLLPILNSMKVDRRLIACILSFGLVMPYMFLPIGFGQIFLNEIVRPQIANLSSEVSDINFIKIMFFPAFSMLIGLMFAIFISYRNERQYKSAKDNNKHKKIDISIYHIIRAISALLIFFIVQMLSNSIAIGALLGCFVMCIGKYNYWKKANDSFNYGAKSMVSIGVTLMSATGLAQVMQQTGHISTLVHSLVEIMPDNQAICILIMLCTGLFITMSIGSSFSTIPLITVIYVPLGYSIGLSIESITCTIIVAAVLGDTGSPISEVTLASSVGLGADDQHQHISDTVIPTFLHFNIPLLVAGLMTTLYYSG